MILWILFIVFSIPILGISWKSLHRPRSHGFYRFFAWEAILALFLLNVETWFVNPLAWFQIVSWLLLIFSLVYLAFGVHALRRLGKPVQQRAGDPSLLAFEKTTSLVTSGIFRYIRHPLYGSLFLLTWGIFFKSPSELEIILAILSSIFLIATAKADEAECAAFFSAPYQEYRRRTKMFIPYLLGL